jgi:acetyltransferase-like isoleucine patch superfamily enzyme
MKIRKTMKNYSLILWVIRRALAQQNQKVFREYNRHVSVGDLIFDRWKTALDYGFGTGTTCYNNVLIIGDVRVGKNCWIGPNVILDGSCGKLEIGDFVSISSGVQIYTHNTVEWSNSMGTAKKKEGSVKIGSGTYIGPNAIISLGVTVGNQCVIGALTFVDKSLPNNSSKIGN